MNAEQTIDAAKNSLQRVQKYLDRLAIARGYPKECIHTFIDKDGDEIPLLVADLKVLLQQVTTTSTNTDTPVVPQGWKLVPVEPTEKMIIEGGCAQTLKDGHRYIGECTAKTAWSFMLAAAPTPPEAFETEGGLVCENSTSKQGAQASVSNMTSAAPVQMPEPFTTLVRKKSWPTNCYEASPLYNHRDYGRLWADERVNVYTEQQVRALLAEASALAAQAKQGERP